MGESLAELYRRTQTSPSLEARLPEDVGDGRIARICTPHGVSLSAWEMRYHQDTPVEGAVGDELRLLFCLGEGAEWKRGGQGGGHRAAARLPVRRERRDGAHVLRRRA